MGTRGMRRRPRLWLWEAGFLVWIPVCYLFVVGRRGLQASWVDFGITLAIFALPSLIGGLISWSLVTTGLRLRRDVNPGGATFLALGGLVTLLTLGVVLGLLAMFSSGGSGA